MDLSKRGTARDITRVVMTLRTMRVQDPNLNRHHYRRGQWVEIMETVLWIASAVFIIYYGDWHSNLIYLLWHDDRIRRIPLYLGMLGVTVNVLFFLYISMLAWGVQKSSEKWEISSTSALPFITVLGLMSFCLFSFALWPIWRFLTLPLVFTLFMACMVILPYLMIGTFKATN
ncbi:hypothetical protein F0562_030081 [Nyssa sinensis]|uniref:Transmembrane protein 128 n=1 Tax=Nyssa sinensis TaxID=561372 RepID=A0A5J5AXQ9_9ASTE|nr:hypothetical protein F0562_030081 [Nyssa sinensis]